MGNEKKMSLSVPVTFAKVDGDPHEGTFQKMVVRICSPGKNRNFSYISKEELDAAKPSLAYVPVVGRIYEKVNADGEVVGYYFGGHDYEVDDNFEWRPTTVPYGVMTVDEPWYETVQEFGRDVEYLHGYCYLWVGRWPELRDAAWDESFWYSQSMEMSYKDYTIYEEDSNFVEFHGCRFDAICILGYDPENPEYNTTPAFPSAGFLPAAEFSLNSAQFSQLMSEMKNQLASSFEHINNYQKGGIGLTTEMRDAIFAKFNLTADAVDFEVSEDMTEQELTEKLEAYTAQTPETTSDEPEAAPAAEPASDAGDVQMEAAEQIVEPAAEEQFAADDTAAETEPALFSATYREKECALDRAVRTLNQVKRGPDGNIVEEIYCYMIDFDDEYVFYNASRYTEGGCDDKMFRCGYSFDEANQAVLAGNCEEVFHKWLTAEEVQKMESDKNQLAELLKFKADVEASENASKVEAMLSEFSDLAGLDEFATIKEEAEQSATPDFANFELRLFALRGKQVIKPVEAQPKNVVKVGIDTDAVDTDNDGYGGLLNRVRNRNK